MKDYTLLSSIDGPSAIRNLSFDEKEQLAQEVRDYIIEIVAANGGHLAPNLGVVDLIISMLSSLNLPEDSVVFDVGHQCYAWKILTDRREEFRSLRRKGGLSGFPKREESPYDSFNTGHSSTSISAALGIARAKRTKGDNSRTVALIGDGSIGGGMAFEALSDAGQSGENLLVILNDNQMCIDQVVGGLAHHFEKLRTSQRYIRLKTTWEVRLDRIPLIGKPIIKLLAAVKRNLRLWRRQDGGIFEQLGFRYYGPIDGHDLKDLDRHLRALRLVRGPVLLHVMTVKGKGYPFAEDAPADYHGVAPFDLINGKSSSEDGMKTFSRVFGETMIELAQVDHDVVAVTAAMMQGTGLQTFSEKFPDRLFDVGIAEQHAVTMAAGMAIGGLKPYVAIYSTFMQRALDQLIHDVCLQNLPVVFALDRAGCVGGDGETHQGIFDLTMTLSYPNLSVFAPATASDLRAVLLLSLRHDGPILIRYPHDIADSRCLLPEDFDEDCDDLSKLVPLRRIESGDDLTVVSLGATLTNTVKAVELVVNNSKNNISIDLFSCISAVPFDYYNMLESIQRTGRLFVVEDGCELGGFGSRIVSEVMRSSAKVSIDFAGVRNRTVGQATRAELLSDEGLDAAGLAERMTRLIEESPKSG
ncbi:MAG: 1-deoxy-D-xylulose-5-phosphate synthase [Clostridiaceae bacterium]|nr:1-deoxy-D-xylulose-5-phosphate synthase [Clostridia bacterium]MBP6950135.1 1-deoxy-D-xylulose-5-phosphate synthase [Clostridia bacterium]NMA36488.1 1-deoxy-D-xylulose-5-phosphate synthase [Clostridiaceae bacterium]